MSTPRSLALPAGVEVVTLPGLDGPIAAHTSAAIGPPRGHVLLIPGWTGSKEDFTPILPLLAQAGFATVAYDQPGQYESAPASSYSLGQFARQAHHLLESMGGRCHVLGHSFGGLVAQQLAVQHPGALCTLSLLDSGPGALGDSPQRPLKTLVDAIGTIPMADIHAARENGVTRPPEIADFLLKRALANDPLSLKAMTQSLIDAPDIIDQVAATGVSVWVGRGADDDAWPHGSQAAMATRLGTTIDVIADSAHSPAIENPDGLIEAWLPFLRTHSA